MPTPPEVSATGRVAVIGGGIAGLAAAWQLQQSGADYTLLEAGDRWGGKIVTERVDGFVIEHGPDAFLTRKPWALALARELGLDERVVGVDMRHSRTYVLKRGRPVPIPDGLRLLAPTRLGPFLRSPLFSLPGKLRVLLESLIPARRDSSDESLASFVRRRLGAEALDLLGEPLLAGIYNGEPEHQSMLATFPQFPAMEREHGSLLRGAKTLTPDLMGTVFTRVVPIKSPSPSGRGEKDNDEAVVQWPQTSENNIPFISFQTGAQELVEALVAGLRGDLRLNAPVQAIERRVGDGYRVVCADGTRVEAEALVLATPARVAGALLAEIAPDAAESLRAIRTAGIGSMSLAFRREDVPHPLDGFGLVIPSSEERAIDGMTWTTSKWNGRAPEGYVLLRVFFGGPHTRATLALDDAALVGIVRVELQAILGVEAEPEFWRVKRWQDGYPQYDVGHLDLLAAIEAALPPDVALAGCSYRGVGVPDCIRQGREAAESAALFLRQQETAL